MLLLTTSKAFALKPIIITYLFQSYNKILYSFENASTVGVRQSFEKIGKWRLTNQDGKPQGRQCQLTSLGEEFCPH